MVYPFFYNFSVSSNKISKCNKRLWYVWQDGMTVLHLAAKYGQTRVLDVLEDKILWSLSSKKVQTIIITKM